MRILFLLTQDLESPTGIGRYYPLAKYLTLLGNQVTIVALHSNFSRLKSKSFLIEGVQVHYVAQMHVLKQDNLKIYFSNTRLIALAIQATIQLSRAALSIPADIIHLGKPHPMNSLAGLFARLFKRRTLFLDYDDYEAASGHFENRWQKMIVQLFEEWVPHWAHHITTNNHFLKERLLNNRIPDQKITILPNGVDIERFLLQHQDEIENLRSKVGFQNKKVVAFIGSLSLPSHPVDLLIEAYRFVASELPDAALLIVGGGEELNNLHRRAVESGSSASTYFTGYVQPSEIPSYYRLADVVIDPVYNDSSARGRLPLKMFESWVTGTPFISSDVGDRKMLLGEPPAGLLVEPGNARELANGILKILQDQAFSRLLIERGLVRVQEYDWKKLAAMMDKVYQGRFQV